MAIFGKLEDVYNELLWFLIVFYDRAILIDRAPIKQLYNCDFYSNLGTDCATYTQLLTT